MEIDEESLELQSLVLKDQIQHWSPEEFSPLSSLISSRNCSPTSITSHGNNATQEHSDLMNVEEEETTTPRISFKLDMKKLNPYTSFHDCLPIPLSPSSSITPRRNPDRKGKRRLFLEDDTDMDVMFNEESSDRLVLLNKPTHNKVKIVHYIDLTQEVDPEPINSDLDMEPEQRLDNLEAFTLYDHNSPTTYHPPLAVCLFY